MALIIPFNGITPRIADDAFVAPNAVLVGDVTVESKASVWFGAVLRGDNPDHGIVVGAGSSVQDQCMVHVGDWGPTIIGPNVTVGHGAVFESCTIGEGSLIGMNAVILQEVVIGKECVIAALSVVKEGSQIPDRSVVAGVPGQIKKTLDGSAAEWVRRSATHYQALSRSYLAEGIDQIEAQDDGAWAVQAAFSARGGFGGKLAPADEEEE
jgi:carbonic anhydrase/acetyltransferase-like protein (isoleucine patch superfamily)